MPRLKWIDTARGIAIIAVVIFHATVVMGHIDLDWKWRSATQLLDTFRMPLFFFASGIVSAGLLHRSWSVTLRRRIAPLAYLYLIWVIFRTAYGQIVHTPGHRPAWSEILMMLGEPHSTLWFLYALVLFGLFVVATRTLPPVVPVMVALAVSLAFTTHLVDDVSLTWEKMGRYAVFFVAGVYLREIALKLAARVSGPVSWLIIAAYIGLTIALTKAGLATVPGVRIVAGAAAVVAGICLAVQISRLALLDWLAYLGRNTLPIYLLHVFWLFAIGAALYAFNVELDPAVLPLVVPAAAAAVIPLSIWTHKATRRIPGLYAPPWNTESRVSPSTRPDRDV